MQKIKSKEYYRGVLRGVINGILDGTLDHDQTEWHCGTSHCVCGWFEVMVREFGEKELTSSKHLPKLFNHVFSTVICKQSDKTYSVSSLDFRVEVVSHLTGYGERTLEALFDGNNTKADIRRIAVVMGMIESTPTINVPEKQKTMIVQSVSGI